MNFTLKWCLENNCVTKAPQEQKVDFNFCLHKSRIISQMVFSCNFYSQFLLDRQVAVKRKGIWAPWEGECIKRTRRERGVKKRHNNDCKILASLIVFCSEADKNTRTTSFIEFLLYVAWRDLAPNLFRSMSQHAQGQALGPLSEMMKSVRLFWKSRLYQDQGKA